MGIITQLTKALVKSPTFPGQSNSRILWEQTFGNISKDKREAYQTPAVQGGSWGRSSLSSNASVKRLVEALRSGAPGGWSDDRYTETSKFTDIRYVAIFRLMELMMEAEFQVYKKDLHHQNGKRPVTEDDPKEGDRTASPYDLVRLLEKPNREDTFGEWCAANVQQLALTGKALTFMLPNALPSGHPDPMYTDKGRPFELYSIPTAIAVPQPVIDPEYPYGFYRIQPLYPYGPFSTYPTPASAVGAPIGREWMLEMKYIHPFLRYDGYSPQTGMRLHLDEIEQIDKSRWYLLKRLVNPSAVLNFQDMDGMQQLPESEIERVKADFENEMQGTENSGRLFVSAPGASLEQWETNLRELQYQEGWDQLVSFVMAALGISKEAAGMIGSTAYAQLYAALKQLYMLTLSPMCARIGAKITRFLAPFFGDDLIVEVKPPKIDDHEIVFSKIQTASSAKCIKKKEVRKLLDLELTGEEWENDMAGDPSPYEKEQQEQQQMAQMAAQQQQMQPQLGQEQPQETPEVMEALGMTPPAEQEDEATAKARPSPEELGEGALGPEMKELRELLIQTKSLQTQEIERIAQPEPVNRLFNKEYIPGTRYKSLKKVFANGHRK